MMDFIFPYQAEPELEEIMNDPMIQELMKKDGIEERDIAPPLRNSIERLRIHQKEYCQDTL